MDSYVKTITLDVNADQNYTIVKAKQGDKINRKIAITLKKDGTNFTPTGVSEIWFRVEKPDKNIAIVKSTDSGNPISVSGNVYTVSLSEQCLTASGKAWCDIAFLDSSGNILSSCDFIMNIIPMPNGNTAESISEWTDLQKAIDDAERFADIVAFRTSESYIQYTVDGVSWTNLMPVSSVSNVFDAGTVTHDDCNNFVEGLVKYTPSTLNIPEPSYGIVCGYVAQDKNWKWQIAETTQNPSKIFKRSNINNGGWSDWKRIADEDDISALSGSLNVFETAKGVSSTSDFGTSSFNFTVTAAFSIGNTGVTLPRYCKGSFICSGYNDAVLYGVDLVNGVFYFAARNSGTWAFAHTYDESYHPFTVTGTIGNGTMYIDDTRITANTRLLEVEFGAPENVPYKYSWTTTAGRLTFASVAGTFSETTVTAILGRTN